MIGGFFVENIIYPQQQRARQQEHAKEEEQGEPGKAVQGAEEQPNQ